MRIWNAAFNSAQRLSANVAISILFFLKGRVSVNIYQSRRSIRKFWKPTSGSSTMTDLSNNPAYSQPQSCATVPLKLNVALLGSNRINQWVIFTWEWPDSPAQPVAHLAASRWRDRNRQHRRSHWSHRWSWSGTWPSCSSWAEAWRYPGLKYWRQVL